MISNSCFQLFLDFLFEFAKDIKLLNIISINKGVTQTVEINIFKSGKTLSIKIQGRIGEVEAETLKDRFRENRLNEIETVTLDMADVTHIGSSGIGKLILIYKDIALKNGKFNIINVPAGILALLKSLKFDQIFPISGIN
ncbi:MAG: STAS domain-containing protein [Candidatus Magnetomorum sp.]|nr:STAS domain-containing protein [Candidatus Magnetomorum sp.]